MIVFAYPRSSGCAHSLEVAQALADFRRSWSVVGLKAATADITPYIAIYDKLHDKASS